MPQQDQSKDRKLPMNDEALRIGYICRRRS